MQRLPTVCPSCIGKLAVKRLYCQRCGTEVEGGFSLPPLASLSGGDQEFLLHFVNASGSLKEMARILAVSYPTVRNRLDAIIAKLKEPLPKKKEKT